MNYQQLQIQYFMKLKDYNQSLKDMQICKEKIVDKICELTPINKDQIDIKDIRIDRYNRSTKYFLFTIKVVIPVRNLTGTYYLILNFSYNTEENNYSMEFNFDSSSIFINEDTFNCIQYLNLLFNNVIINNQIMKFYKLWSKYTKEEDELSSLNDIAKKNKDVVKECITRAPAGSIFEVTILERESYWDRNDYKFSAKLAWIYHNKLYLSDFFLNKASDSYDNRIYEVNKGYLIIDKFYRKKVILSVIGDINLYKSLLTHHGIEMNTTAEVSENLKHIKYSLELTNVMWQSLLNSNVVPSSFNGNYIMVEPCSSPIAKKIFTNSYSILGDSLVRTMLKNYKDIQLKLNYDEKDSNKLFSATKYAMLNDMINQGVSI